LVKGKKTTEKSKGGQTTAPGPGKRGGSARCQFKPGVSKKSGLGGRAR